MLEYPSLRFIAARHVETGVTYLTGFDVLTATGKKIGALDGLIVDPPERAIKFAVVKRDDAKQRRRLIVPLSLARLNVDGRALHVDVTSDRECPAFDPEAFPTYSDEDFQAAFLA